METYNIQTQQTCVMYRTYVAQIMILQTPYVRP